MILKTIVNVYCIVNVCIVEVIANGEIIKAIETIEVVETVETVVNIETIEVDFADREGVTILQTEKASKTRRCHLGDVRSCQIAIINLVAVNEIIGVIANVKVI